MKKAISGGVLVAFLLLMFFSCSTPQPISSSLSSSIESNSSTISSVSASISFETEMPIIDYTTQGQLSYTFGVMYSTFGKYVSAGISPGEVKAIISDMQPDSPAEYAYIMLCMISTVNWENSLIELARLQEFSLLTFGVDILSLKAFDVAKDDEAYEDGYITIWGAGFHDGYQITSLDYSENSSGEIYYSFKCVAKYLDVSSPEELGSYQASLKPVKGEYGIYAELISCVEI